MEWRFTALGTGTAVRCQVECLIPRLELELHGYRELHQAVDLHYELRLEADVFELYRDEERHYQSENADELIDFFLGDLYRRLTIGDQEHWLLHAALLVRNERSVVLAGPSGSGKSTLTRTLLDRGWSYESEEVARLGQRDRDGLRRPLHGDASDRDALSKQWPCHELSNGHWIAMPSFHEGPIPPLAALLRLEYAPGGPTTMTRRSPSQGLQDLWPCRMNSGLSVARLAATILSATPSYRLMASGEREAADLIEALVGE